MSARAPPRRGFALLTAALAFVFGLLVAEVALRAFATPYRTVTIGTADSAAGQRYGWGYRPHQRFLLADPDTGAVLPSHANSRGWRDAEHTLANATGAFRVVVVGDSNTFGPIVAQEQTWPRLLERRAREAGFDVEVIALAYGAWGTDQKLEALVGEGLAYAPDLVILQYSTNDVAFNVADADESGLPKPFRYRLDPGGALRREANPAFTAAQARTWPRVRAVLLRSEVLARLHGLLERWRLGRVQPDAGHVAGPAQVARLQALFGIDDAHPLVTHLRARPGTPLDATGIAEAARSGGLAASVPLILRICEDRWFNAQSAPGLDVPAVDVAGQPWRLFLALLARAHEVAAGHGAAFALFADIDDAGFDWNVYWGRVRDTLANRARHLEPRHLVGAFAAARGIGVVGNARPHLRARNDPHQTAAGTAAMAANVFDYLVSAHGTALAQHRLDPGATVEGAAPRP
jgi:lysophospholipase L1-like esterase